MAQTRKQAQIHGSSGSSGHTANFRAAVKGTRQKGTYLLDHPGRVWSTATHAALGGYLGQVGGGIVGGETGRVAGGYYGFATGARQGWQKSAPKKKTTRKRKK